MRTKQQNQEAEKLMQEVESEIVSGFKRLGIEIYDLHHTGEGEVTIIYSTDEDEDYPRNEMLMNLVREQAMLIKGLQKEIYSIKENLKYLTPYGVRETQEDTNLKDLVNGRLTDAFMSARGLK